MGRIALRLRLGGCRPGALWECGRVSRDWEMALPGPKGSHMNWERYSRGVAVKPRGYPRGVTIRREGLRPYEFMAFVTAVTLLTALLLYVSVHLISVSDRLERMESQLQAVDSQLRRVDALTAASMVAPRDAQRTKEAQVSSPARCPDMSGIESRLSSLQYSIGGFGGSESVKSQLDELKSQLTLCRR